jgi:hypothetical protein
LAKASCTIAALAKGLDFWIKLVDRTGNFGARTLDNLPTI